LSKERARLRAEREREAGIKRAARAAEEERRERRAARRRAVSSARDRLGLRSAGRPTGSVSRRRRTQHRTTLLLLAVLVALVFVVRPDWPARVAAVLVAVLAYPVLRTLLFRRA
jgi:Flp pilus assembly protein TadB